MEWLQGGRSCYTTRMSSHRLVLAPLRSKKILILPEAETNTYLKYSNVVRPRLWADWWMSRRQIFAGDKNLGSVLAKGGIPPAKPAVWDSRRSCYGRRPGVCPRNILARDIPLRSDTLHIWNWASFQSSTCQRILRHIWSSCPCRRTNHHKQSSFPYQRGSSRIIAARGRLVVSWRAFVQWQICYEKESEATATLAGMNEQLVASRWTKSWVRSFTLRSRSSAIRWEWSRDTWVALDVSL